MKKRERPNITARLLWEFDYENFNFDKSYKILIERVLERGDMDQWRTIPKGRYWELLIHNWKNVTNNFHGFVLNYDFVNVV
ncbi:DUF6922 domain-containing protein [Dyadobacter sp. 32]|uniref:DUF6922 domain-containing protein n=1 Tax=Dyadobacter sp. 32 TaxID=538966 RepID=UPI0011EF1C28